jgi:hypothetical protein
MKEELVLMKMMMITQVHVKAILGTNETMLRTQFK